MKELLFVDYGKILYLENDKLQEYKNTEIRCNILNVANIENVYTASHVCDLEMIFYVLYQHKDKCLVFFPKLNNKPEHITIVDLDEVNIHGIMDYDTFIKTHYTKVFFETVAISNKILYTTNGITYIGLDGLEYFSKGFNIVTQDVTQDGISIRRIEYETELMYYVPTYDGEVYVNNTRQFIELPKSDYYPIYMEENLEYIDEL